MIEGICLALLGMTVLVLCICMVSDGHVSKELAGKALAFLSVLFVFFALIFEPDNFIRWDLLEHFKIIDEMRSGGWHYVTTESQYVDLFVYNYFAYFISLLPKSFQNLLTVIPLIIDFIIVTYIYKKIYNEYLPETNGKTRVLSVFLWLCTFGIKLAISGIRCSLAISIAALAVFLELIQNRRKKLSIFFYVISLFVHNFAIVVILVRLATKISNTGIKILLSLGISLALEPVAKFVVDNLDSNYLVFSFNRVLETVQDTGFLTAVQTFNTALFLVYLCFVAFAIYLFVISARAKQIYTEDGYAKRVSDLAVTVGAVAIGLSFNYLYIERFMYLISYVFLMITPLHNRHKNGINIGNILVIPATLFVFFFNDIYFFIVNYVGSYFLAF